MSSTRFVRPTIPGRFLAELVVHAGADGPRLLGEVGVPRSPAALDKHRASVEQFEKLFFRTRRAMADESFGYFRERCPLGSYALVLRLGSGSRNLADFIESLTRFYALFDGGHRHLAVERVGARAIVRFEGSTPEQTRSLFFVHSLLLGLLRSAAWLVATPLAPLAVRFDPSFRAYASESAYLFGREPTFVANTCELELDAAWLRLPSRVTADDADGYARMSLRQMLDAPPRDTLEHQIRRVLASDRPFASADLVSVAQRLHVSRATLARRLAQRGLTFQVLKDKLRRDHAIALLVYDGLSIADVAERLGFSEPSAFTRAFKAWTNVPPSRYQIKKS